MPAWALVTPAQARASLTPTGGGGPDAWCRRMRVASRPAQAHGFEYGSWMHPSAALQKFVAKHILLYRICFFSILTNSFYIFGEAVSKLKKFSDDPCFPDPENWMSHVTNEMVQIFSLTLAKTPINSDSVQLYGYLAVRDYMDGRLNYVFNRTRDKPVIVQKGSYIEMNGPSRGIVMLSEVLMEFDMRIKIGEKEADDIELIDGLACLNECISMKPFTLRFSGSCGSAVDMCLALVYEGMEATIEVVISEVQGVLDLSISSVVSIIEEQHKEIQLFHGPVCEFCKKIFVVAAPVDNTMHMKFRVGTKGTDGNTEHLCSFDVNQIGCADRQIKLEAACISVKETVVSAYI